MDNKGLTCKGQGQSEEVKGKDNMGGLEGAGKTWQNCKGQGQQGGVLKGGDNRVDLKMAGTKGWTCQGQGQQGGLVKGKENRVDL